MIFLSCLNMKRKIAEKVTQHHQKPRLHGMNEWNKDILFFIVFGAHQAKSLWCVRYGYIHVFCTSHRQMPFPFCLDQFDWCIAHGTTSMRQVCLIK